MPLPNVNSTSNPPPSNNGASVPNNQAFNPANENGIHNDEQRRFLDQQNRISQILEKMHSRLQDITSVKQNLQQGAYNAFGNNFVTRGGIALADTLGDAISDAIFGRDEQEKAKEDPIQKLLKEQQKILIGIEDNSHKQIQVLENFAQKIENGVIGARQTDHDVIQYDPEEEKHKKAFGGMVDQIKDFHPHAEKIHVDEVLDSWMKSPKRDADPDISDAIIKSDEQIYDNSDAFARMSSILEKISDHDDKANKDALEADEKHQKEANSFFANMADILSSIEKNTEKDKTDTDDKAKKREDSSRITQNGKKDIGDDFEAKKSPKKFDTLIKNLTTGFEKVTKSITELSKNTKQKSSSWFTKLATGGAGATIASKTIDPVDKKESEKIDSDDKEDKTSFVEDIAKDYIGFKALSKIAPMASKLLKATPYIGGAVALGTAAYGAYDGYNHARETLDLGRDATEKEKIASAAGTAIEDLSFGIIDKKKTSSWFNDGKSLDSMEADLKASDPKKYEEYIADKKKIYQNALIDRGDEALAESDMEQALKQKYSDVFATAKTDLQSPDKKYSNMPMEDASNRDPLSMTSPANRLSKADDIDRLDKETKAIEDSVASRKATGNDGVNIVNNTNNNQQVIMPTRRIPNNTETSFNRYMDSAFAR